MTGNGAVDIRKDMEFGKTVKEIFTKESGKLEKRMAKAYKNGEMVENIFEFF